MTCLCGHARDVHALGTRACRTNCGCLMFEARETPADATAKAELLQATCRIALSPCSEHAFSGDVVRGLLTGGIAQRHGGWLTITGLGRAFLAAVAVRPAEVRS